VVLLLPEQMRYEQVFKSQSWTILQQSQDWVGCLERILTVEDTKDGGKNS